nr:hypothetical protein [Bacteroidota bacterium]
MPEGFWSVEVEGEAPAKFHCHDVGLFVLRSLKSMHCFSQKMVSDD